MPGSQIVQWQRIKTSKAKIRRARLGRGDGGGGKNGLSTALARFSHFLLLNENDFPPPSRSLEQAREEYRTGQRKLTTEVCYLKE